MREEWRGGSGMATADVTVRGAGVFGLAVAWACAARGARVRVIDPAGPGAGASGGLVGALCPHVPERWDAVKDFQFRSLRMAGAWWDAVARAGGVDPGYGRIGRLQPLPDAAAVARARARAPEAARRWGDAFAWEVVPAGADPAWEPAAASGLLLRDTLSARISPRRALRALVAAIAARGGEVVAEGPTEGALVLAAGAAGLASEGLGGAVKGQAALLACDGAGRAQIAAPGLYIVPHADGTVAVGSTTERTWEDPAATDGQLDALIARARALCPALAGARVLERWAGLRPRAASGQPLIGPHPHRAGAFIANGGFKIGFGLAPLAGETMADLVLDGADRIPDAFRPVR